MMKHSNRFFVCKVCNVDGQLKKHFVEVDGHKVKNSHGLDLFWHLNQNGKKILSEGVTGLTITADYPEDVDVYLEGSNWGSDNKRAEIYRTAIEKAVSDDFISPRYTDPENNKPPKEKPRSSLQTPVFIDGKFNRSGKKIRVKPEMTVGKYQIFSHEECGENVFYFMTESGLISRLSDYFHTTWDANEQKHVIPIPSEADFQAVERRIRDRFENAISDPTKWAYYQDAAVLNRIADCDAHNIPVRKLQEDKRKQKREELETEEKAREATANERHQRNMEEWSEHVKANQVITGEQFLELCTSYGVMVPIKVKGWAMKSLVEISNDGYRYRGNKSTTILNYYDLLKNKIEMVSKP